MFRGVGTIVLGFLLLALSKEVMEMMVTLTIEQGTSVPSFSGVDVAVRLHAVGDPNTPSTPACERNVGCAARGCVLVGPSLVCSARFPRCRFWRFGSCRDRGRQYYHRAYRCLAAADDDDAPLLESEQNQPDASCAKTLTRCFAPRLRQL